MNKRPNILFILSDDQGAWAMGCAGNAEIKTPAIDSIARQGVMFDNFYCASPVCSPARASIVTGKIPSCHGVQDWIRGGNLEARRYPQMAALADFDMDDTAIDYLSAHKTYMQLLAENGYDCYLSGKWHLGDNARRREGFLRWYTIGRGGCHYMQPDICDEGETSIGDKYVTELITERALKYLDGDIDGARPFYLSVHYTAPHSPWEAYEHPEKYINMYRDCPFNSTPDLTIHKNQVATCPTGDTPARRRENLTGYYAAISAMDDGIGRIIDKLKQRGLYDNTIIVLTADNGMNMGHHGVWGKGNGTYPPNMYESSIKVPFIIHMPGGPSGEVCRAAATQYDIFPTILELAGCAPVRDEKMPGKSLVDMIANPGAPVDDEVFIYDEYGMTRMIKQGNMKYVHRYNGGECEFYLLDSDPDETTNLYGRSEYENVISALHAQLEKWFARYADSLHDGRNSPATGSGQMKECYKQQAFHPSIQYFYAAKEQNPNA